MPLFMNYYVEKMSYWQFFFFFCLRAQDRAWCVQNGKSSCFVWVQIFPPIPELVETHWLESEWKCKWCDKLAIGA